MPNGGPRPAPTRSWSSAHGGRNLDCLPAPADCIPAIAAAVNGRLTILADSGVRRGTDVLKYLAMGAEAVLVGRLPLWGLAAEVEAGAEAVLRMILRRWIPPWPSWEQIVFRTCGRCARGQLN